MALMALLAGLCLAFVLAGLAVHLLWIPAVVVATVLIFTIGFRSLGDRRLSR